MSQDDFCTPLNESESFSDSNSNSDQSYSDENESCSDACSESNESNPESYESCDLPEQDNPESERSKRTSNVESRREQKIRKLDRQSSKKTFPLLQSLKPLWEQSRQSSLSPKDRASLIEQMYKESKGNIAELIFKHDASRIVQTIIKYSTEQQRASIYTELKGKFAELCQGKYSKHLVSKMLKLCPSKRASIVQEIGKNSKKLMRNREASKIIELVFMQYTNAKEKRALLLPFCGPEFRLFPENNKPLKELFSGCEEEKKSKIISDLLASISTSLDKGMASNAFLHHLMAEYLQICSEEQSNDLMKLIREQLVEILHTHIGYRIVCRCIASSSAKERKAILKAFKPFLTKISQDEFGHLVLICCLVLIDDIVLLEKTILPPASSVSSLIDDPYFKKFLLFPFVGLDTKHYSNDFVQMLTALLGTSTKLEFTKKPLEQKLVELKALLKDSILPLFSSLPKSFIVDRSKSVLFMELNENENLFLEALEQDPNDPGHVLFSENGGFFYKKLAQRDNFALKIFSRIKNAIPIFAMNEKSCFLILTLFNEPSTKDMIYESLSPSKVSLQEASRTNNKISILYRKIFE